MVVGHNLVIMFTRSKGFNYAVATVIAPFGRMALICGETVSFECSGSLNLVST
jgi:hypothetical protein